MVSEVTIGAGMRTNLLSLQRTSQQIDRTQNILSTGLRVAKAIDDPQNYFAARALSHSASNLLSLLDGVGQSIQTIQAASTAVEAIDSLLDQADSIVQSAREALTDGEVQAKLTGNTSLSGVTDLTSLSGVADGDDLVFTYLNTSGVQTSATVNIASGDSIDELITNIKDIGGGGYFNAALTSAGYLEITEARGNSFNLVFDSDGAVTASAGDLALADALGFGDQVSAQTRVGGASTDANAEITVLNSTKLVSGAFYEEGGSSNGYAEASDLLTSVVDSSGGSNYRFVANSGSPLNLTFTVNGSTSSANIDIDGLTIQGLVDAINNDSNVGSLLSASYDASNGKLTIEPISSTVETVNVTVTDTVAGGASTTEADFDFGLDTEFLPGAALNDAEGETFQLAQAATLLEGYEEDFNSVLTQIDELLEDAGYKGVNLTEGDTLYTYFNEDRSNKLETTGRNLATSALGISEADFSTLSSISSIESQLLAARNTVNSFGSSIATALSVIEVRESFISDYVDILNEGADKLTVADQNEEGARLLALQTRMELGVSALSLASEAQKSVLRLF